MKEGIEQHSSVERAEAVIRALSEAIVNRLARPLYLKIEHLDGQLSIEQVEYLTAEELASLAKVDARTVYSWFDKGVLGYCKPPGTGQNLIPMQAAIDWIDSSATKKVKAKRPKKEAEG